MNSTMRIAKAVVRWSLGCVLLGLTIVVLFLSGYFLGWKNSGVTATSESAVPDSLASSEIGDSARVDKTDDHARSRERAASRLSRLAGWLLPGRHRRSSSARVLAEIGNMHSGEARHGLELLERAPDSTVVGELRALLLLRWATESPGDAFAYWRADAEGTKWPESVAADLFIRWASRDPRAALEGWRAIAGQTTDPGSNYGYALRQIFSRLAQDDFEAAMAEASQLTGESRTEALRGVASLAVKDSHRGILLQSLAALPAGPERAKALAEGLAAWFTSGGADAAVSWLDSAQLDSVDRSKIQDEIARRWFMKDRLAAAEWLVSRARTSTERARALEEITFQWTQYDPVAAGRWLVAQGLDADASRAMQIYADRVVADFPAEAVEWARSIPTEEAREKALANVTKRVRELHPKRAAELLNASR